MDTGVARLIRDGATGPADDATPAASLSAADSAPRLQRWGFLAQPDLPDRPGPAFLLVALRPGPTLEHYDPEAVEYWVTVDGHGQRRTLTHDSPMPQSEDFAWGLIRLVDRLGVSNEYLTFGGHLDAAVVDSVVVVAFASGVPLLRRGGHSQGVDPGADAVGAFFGRLMVAVDYQPGYEAALAAADPLTRYAAFVRDADERRRRPGRSPSLDDSYDRLIRSEATRLQATERRHWELARALLASANAA